MHTSDSTIDQRIQAFCRNRYVYGKLLDVYHFELEQDYFNSKRWLINRLVCGYGVICGLDVHVRRDGRSIEVTRGVAIDKWGREIVVPGTSQPVPLPESPAHAARPHDECEDEDAVHVCICYHECLADPVPVLQGECCDGPVCTPGSICERYSIEFRQGRIPAIDTDCPVPDLVSGNRINYPALANYVSGDCPEPPEDPCIVLANIDLPDPGKPLDADAINIAVRPIVYGNDLLHDFLVCLTGRGRPERAK